MKSHRAREKSSSLKKSSKGPRQPMPKALSVRELPKFTNSSDKKTSNTKRKTSHTTSIEQRVANIQKGFVDLERKLFTNNTLRASIRDSEVKRLLENASRSSKTRHEKQAPHRCVYEKAVYSLIGIIEQQKVEIEMLRREVASRARR